MKVLHVCTVPWGGAFNGAYRLHLALLTSGVDSKMLVNFEPDNSGLNNVFVYNTPFRKPTIANRILTKFGKPVTATQKKNYYKSKYNKTYEIITFPFSDYDVTNSHYFKEADIINLHWIGDFLDYNSFFSKVNKPVVWTLRDLGPTHGVFHYELDKIRNESIFKDLELKYHDYKIKALKRSNIPIHIVGLSNWITSKAKLSVAFNRYPHSTIPNCINIKEYRLEDRDLAKASLNICKNKIILSFASLDINNPYKGADMFVAAINDLKSTAEIELITFGSGSPPKFPMHIVHRHFGNLQKAEINKIFSASDAFIFPTKEEALGNLMLEAMACGTPVIGYKVGGLLDVIKPGINGLFSENISSEGLKQAILKFIETRDVYSPARIRKFIQENFSEELVAEKYISIYKSLCC